jgi:dienelactone hydrolase
MKKISKYILLLLTPFAFLTIQGCVGEAKSNIISEEVTYTDGDITMKGYIAYDDSIKGKRPGVIVVHEWWGHNDYSRKRADMLAKEGYTAIALDMFGDGKNTDHPKDAKAFATEVRKKADAGKGRFEAGLNLLKKHKTVNAEQISAAGYCFGGGVILDMVRKGIDLDMVGVFHGGLKTNNAAAAGSLAGKKVMVFNGADDKSVKLEQVQDFIAEMSAAKADLTVVNYPDTVHAFTNPGATAIGERLKYGNLRYNEKADKDSWSKFTNALANLY